MVCAVPCERADAFGRKEAIMTPREKNGKAKKSKAAPVAAAPETQDGTGNVENRGFPIVGIGASAGGLAAFEAFFSGMPADVDPGMAFVLVQHLAPDHKSILTDLIRRYTRMQVFEGEDGMANLGADGITFYNKDGSIALALRDYWWKLRSLARMRAQDDARLNEAVDRAYARELHGTR